VWYRPVGPTTGITGSKPFTSVDPRPIEHEKGHSNYEILHCRRRRLGLRLGSTIMNASSNLTRAFNIEAEKAVVGRVRERRYSVSRHWMPLRSATQKIRLSHCHPVGPFTPIIWQYCASGDARLRSAADSHSGPGNVAPTAMVKFVTFVSQTSFDPQTSLSLWTIAFVVPYAQRFVNRLVGFCRGLLLSSS
jgi:hypothetical protein